MKMFWAIVITFVLSGLLAWFTPWWVLVFPAFIIGFFMHLSPIKSFISGFLGIGLLWLAVASYVHWSCQILSARISHTISLPAPVLLVVMTGVIGGVVGGMASMAGFYLWGGLKAIPTP